MTKEDKELLFKDLSSRLPYHVRVKVWLKDGTTEEGVLDLKHNYADVLRDAFYYNKIIEIKPYLRSMSSMTEEETKEYRKTQITKWVKSVDCTNGGYYEHRDTLKTFDWFLAHHFDYRDLINKGLAIAVIEENNPYKQYIIITQDILDYIEKNSHNFENPMPTLGEKWIVDGEFTYSGVCGGQPVIEIHKTTGEFMRLPKSIVKIR